jgi:muramidase (phage lysozyme)
MTPRGALLAGIAAGAGVLFVMREAEASTMIEGGAAGLLPSAVSDIAAQFGVMIDDALGYAPDSLEIDALSGEQNINAFLHMIIVAEHGRDDPIVYQTLFGGGLFESFADHPRIAVTATIGGKRVTSTAAGAGQILARTWDGIRGDLPDFSPESQRAAMVKLIRRRGALADVREGRIPDAIRKCAREWASLPGSPYGQPTISLDTALSLFNEGGGLLA